MVWLAVFFHEIISTIDAGFCIWPITIPRQKRKCTMKFVFMICDFHGNDDVQVFEIWIL
jgi:hypothetical protein